MTTPMRRQYLDLKQQYPDAILFFRLGDFYETFDDDARLVAEVCDITLTSRPVGKDVRVPLAGVPYHSAEGYIAKLLRAGHRIAIAEQAADESDANLMRRQVVRVVTPGTVTEDGLLSASSNNFLAALTSEGGQVGLAYADVSTGEFLVEEHPAHDAEAIVAALGRIHPAECVTLEDDAAARALVAGSAPATTIESWRLHGERAARLLRDHFAIASLTPLGLDDRPAAARAAALCLLYLSENHLEVGSTLTSLRFLTGGDRLHLDSSALRTLEIVDAGRNGGSAGSLLGVLDQTRTPMGARLLRRRLLEPSGRTDEIRSRLDGVEGFAAADTTRARARDVLAQMPDLERLSARLAQDALTPRRALAIAAGCRLITALSALLNEPRVALGGEARDALEALDDCSDIAALIEETVSPDAPATLNTPGIIRSGLDPDLDTVVERATNSRRVLADLEEHERERTGLKGLKVGHNNVFGYYLELPRSQADRVPAEYIRKQTLVNAERYFTEELKTLEADIYGAQDRRLEMERALWEGLVQKLRVHSQRLLAAARRIAVLDVASALAEVARAHAYCRPEVDDSNRIEILQGRHPVVERYLAASRGSFVPNDTAMSADEEAVLVITGPNMAGKSTYLRQVALIAIAAQAGSFVPAESARIGLVDRVFTRIGAQDELSAGQSTFMVEMVEVANILRQATPRSLVVLDEVGRGTSTYDGMAIARAVVEHLHNAPGLGCRTLFATHYHELIDLEQYLPRVRNYNVAVAEDEDGVVFLHRIVRGGADRSYGIHVARLAGVPAPVLRRADEVLERLESQRQTPTPAPALTPSARQLGLFSSAADGLAQELAQTDVDSMSPIEALNRLDALRRQAQALLKRSRKPRS